MNPRRTAGTLLAAIAIATTAACGTSSDDQPAQQADAISIKDVWVKSAKAGQMTAAFGVLRNSSDRSATIVSAASPVSPMMQLHETVTNASGEPVMQQKKGGFTVPANGSFTLAPGGNHIMFMGLKKDLAAGDTVPVTLTFTDGSKKLFTAVAKDFSGAKESYSGTKTPGTVSPSPTMSGMTMGN